MKYISGGNGFRKEKLNEICDALKTGEEIEIIIDCIGHTRNNMEQEAYKEALIKEFGEDLVIKFHGGYCSYSYSYILE